MRYDPDLVRKTETTVQFSALARTGLDVTTIGTWDPDLLRESRVLVPVDVQALVVPAGGDKAVELPGPLTPGSGDTPGPEVVDGPEPLGSTTTRPAGVHLQWAMPDALLRGRLQDPRGRTGGGLELAALPDRWAVLRLLAPKQGGTAHVRGWVLDAAAGVARDLTEAADGPVLPLGPARALSPAELTGAAGGSLTWTGAYDASFGRFAWHDPLDDVDADATLGGALPGGPAAGAATYVVVGWWSDPALDPLDDVRTSGGLAERTEALGWRVVSGADDGTGGEAGLGRLAELGVPVGQRLPPMTGSPFSRETGRARDSRAAGPVSTAGLPEVAFEPSTIAAFRSVGALSFAKEAGLWVSGRGVGVEASTVLHGAVVSVPLPSAGGGIDVDLRPEANAVTITLGEHVDDLAAAAVGARLGLDDKERLATERLLSAFSAGLLARLSDPDGLVEVDEREHAGAFSAVDPGDPALIDRVLTGRAAVPPRPPRPQASSGVSEPPRLFFVTELGAGKLRTEPSGVTISRATDFAVTSFTEAGSRTGAAAREGAARPGRPPAPSAEEPASRSAQPGEQLVERPAPRRYVPLDPVVGVLGGGRGLRHGGDGRADPDERLSCRRGSQVVRGYAGLISGAEILPSLTSGTVPAETLPLAREALLLSPHLLDWLAGFAAGRSGTVDTRSATSRVGSEMVLRYGAGGGYLGKGSPSLTLGRGDADPVHAQTRELLRRHSMLEGVEPDLVAITSWAQPWVPMWLEWSARVTPADDLSGWVLGPVDVEPGPDGRPAERPPLVVTGRSPLTTAPGTALGGAVAEWLVQEEARDKLSKGEADADTADRIAALGRHAASLDLLGGSLDGLRTALLGLPRTALRPRDADGATVPPAPVALPELLSAGSVEIDGVRLVDAFGRILDLDPARAQVPLRSAVGGRPGVLARPPRFSAPTRCLARLVDAAGTDPVSAVDAVVDEIEPDRQISPVAGFLLPDHVDESVEVFGADGTPIGELSVDARGGGVRWECAPGRPLPADAAPGDGLDAAQRTLGLIAAGMVGADAHARDGRAADADGAPKESALSAFLRAMDTTLWTVDPVAGAGSSGLASIVGRPAAVVRLSLELDVGDDLDELTLSTDERSRRALAYAGLARAGVRVRIGELTRADDGVLGWFADDDYRRYHVVDKVVRDAALEAGKGRGHLGEWGTTPDVPAPDPIDHPYLAPDDELVLHPGVPRLLTVLMLPGAALTVTAGVVPRQALRLSRAWFAPGLERISPSVRVGPLLVDPGEVRLPAVAALGEKQVLTSRDGPLSWRNDAILAATQAALLPDRSMVLREGWIRVDPAAGVTATATDTAEAGP